MNIDLAQMYGTPGAEEAHEEQEKVAQYSLFAKLAADNDIDLGALDDSQVAELWNATFDGTKLAGETCDECDELKDDCTCYKGEKTSAADIEFLEQKEWTEKVAEADYLGRVMAHSYVQELGEIGDNMDHEKTALSRGLKARAALERGKRTIGSKAKDFASRYKSTVSGEGTAQAKGLIGKAEKRVAAAQRRGQMVAERQGGLTGAKKKLLKERAKRVGAIGAPIGATVGAGYAMGKDASIDDYAFELAMHKASESGWDPEECGDRINSVFTLGLFDEENTKIASADDTEGAIEIRSLEMLESAGYDVNWG